MVYLGKSIRFQENLREALTPNPSPSRLRRLGEGSQTQMNLYVLFVVTRGLLAVCLRLEFFPHPFDDVLGDVVGEQSGNLRVMADRALSPQPQ